MAAMFSALLRLAKSVRHAAIQIETFKFEKTLVCPQMSLFFNLEPKQCILAHTFEGHVIPEVQL